MNASAPSDTTPITTTNSTHVGMYELATAHTSMPEAPRAVVEPEITPGAPATLNSANDVSRSHTRLHSTPATTSALASATRSIRARLRANTKMQNGTKTPATISNQKNGAVAPVAMIASVSAPAAPG